MATEIIMNAGMRDLAIDVLENVRPESEVLEEVVSRIQQMRVEGKTVLELADFGVFVSTLPVAELSELSAVVMSLISTFSQKGYCCKGCWTEIFHACWSGAPYVSLVHSLIQHKHASDREAMDYMTKIPVHVPLTVAALMLLLNNYITTGTFKLNYVTETSMFKRLRDVICGTFDMTEVDVQDEDVFTAQLKAFSFSSVLWKILKLLVPGLTIADKEFDSLVREMRGMTTIISGTERILGLLMRIFESYANKYGLFEDNANVQEWCAKVDEISPLCEVPQGTGFTSERNRLARFAEHRVEVFQLYKRGLQYVRQTEIANDRSMIANGLKVRVKRLQQIIASNVGSFVGTEGKLCPLVLYFHGSPGTGKTTLVDHLFRDIYSVLGAYRYDPMVDKYSYNSQSAYFDTYNYQRVFEIQDFLQLRDMDIAVREISNLMHMADESAFALNMAECEAKGTMFFCSEFIYMSSNLSLDDAGYIISDKVHSPEAFRRRIDLEIQVEREVELSSEKFCKDAMTFTIDGHKVSYNELVAMIVKIYMKKQRESKKKINCEDTFTQERVDEILGMLDDVVLPRPRQVGRCYCWRCYKQATECELCLSCTGTPSGIRRWRLGKRFVDYRTFELALASLTTQHEDCVLCSNWKGRHYGQLRGHWNLDHTNPSLATKLGTRTKHTCSSECHLDVLPLEEYEGEVFSYEYTAQADDSTGTEAEGENNSQQSQTGSENGLSRVGFAHFSDEPLQTTLTAVQLVAAREIKELLEYRELTPEDYRYLESVSKSGRFNLMMDSLYIDNGFSLTLRFYETLQGWKQTEVNEASQWDFRSILRRLWALFKKPFTGVYCVLRSAVTKVYENLCQAFTYARNTIANFSNWITKKAVSFTIDKFFREASARVLTCILAFVIYELVQRAWNTIMGGIKMIKMPTLPEAPSFLVHSRDDDPKWQGARSGRRPPRKIRGPRKRRPHQAHSSQQFNDLVGILRRCLGRLSTDYGTMHCLAIRDYIVVVPEHAIVGDDAELILEFKGRTAFKVNFADVSSWHCEDNHSYILDLSTVMIAKGMRPFPSLIKKVVQNDEYGLMSKAVLVSTVGPSGELMYKQLTGLEVDTIQEYVKFDVTNHVYAATDLLKYVGAVQKGDCGCPIIVEVNGQWKVAGIHIAGKDSQRSMMGIGAQLSREWLVENIVDDVPDDVVETCRKAVFDTHVMDVVDGPVEVLQRLDKNLVFLPRKSKLIHSPFYDGYTLTAPAPLKGWFNGKTPAEISFSRFENPTAMAADTDHFTKSVKYVMTPYVQKVGKVNQPFILTLEDAVFGIPDDPYIEKMDSRAGVGFPWTERYKRQELFDIEKNYINPEFRKVVSKTMQTFKNGLSEEFLVVDILKDERLPVEKVASGKARMFSILPVHINVVLKMLFGAFSRQVMQGTSHHIVKLGLSIKMDQVKDLELYLKIFSEGQQFLCGDISASDRVIPYEIFMLITRSVNTWYADDFCEARLVLSQKVFRPTHVFNEVVYRSSAGMPSGSYLTSLYNSLAYGIMLSQCWHDLIGNFSGLRLATFGDDHVISFPEGVDLDPEKVVEWFAYYGMKYTAADKDQDVRVVDWNNVQFLKRSFAKLGGLTVFRLDIENICDSVKWYRRTATTGNWSDRMLLLTLIDCVGQELCLHGKQVFHSFFRKYKDLLTQETIPLPDFEYYLSLYCDLEPIGTHDSLVTVYVAQMDDDLQKQVAEATIVGTAQITSKADQVTYFRDYEGVEASVCTDVGLPVLDGSFEWGGEYCKQIERVARLFRMAVGAPTWNGPIARLAIDSMIFESPYILERINHATHIRYDIKIEIRIAATRYHTGVLFFVPRPHLGANQLSKEMFSKAFHFWDHFMTASQLPHLAMSVGAGVSGTITIPWCLPEQYVQVKDLCNMYTTLCVLDVYLISAIHPVEAPKVEVIVFGGLQNVKLYGFAQQAKRPIVMDTKSWTLQPVYAMIQPVAVVERFENIWTAQNDREQKQMERTWVDKVQTLSMMGGPIVRLVQGFGTVMQMLGLCKPRIPEGPKPVVTTLYPTAVSVGLDLSSTLSFKSDDALTAIPRPEDEMDIEHIGSKMSFVSTFELKNPVKPISLAFAPWMMYALDRDHNLFCTSPAGYISMNHAAVRSGLRVQFQFYASAYVSCRLCLQFDRELDVTETTNYMAPTYLIDVQGNTVVTFDVPRTQHAYFSSYDHRVSSRFVINIKPVSSIVANELSRSGPILCVVMAGYPGLQFHTPCPVPVQKDRGGTFTVGFFSQGEPVPMVGSPGSAGVRDKGTNVVTSLYHMMKKPSTMFPIQGPNGFLPILKPVMLPVGHSYVMQRETMSSMMLMYKYWRGSVVMYFMKGVPAFVADCHDIWKSNIKKERLDRPTGFPECCVSSLGSYQVLEDVKAVHIPFRSVFPYEVIPQPEPNQVGMSPVYWSQHSVYLRSGTYSHVARSVGDDFQMFGFLGVPMLVIAEMKQCPAVVGSKKIRYMRSRSSEEIVSKTATVEQKTDAVVHEAVHDTVPETKSVHTDGPRPVATVNVGFDVKNVIIKSDDDTVVVSSSSPALGTFKSSIFSES